MPILTSTLGIDGGAVFQILALENLGLDSRAVGIAFGLGLLSIPLQVGAARMPLWRARQNLRIFLLISAALCWSLALLIAVAEPGTRPASLALVITVAAEVILSVLFATAWFPLMSYSLTGKDRQLISSRVHAIGSVAMIVGLIIFSQVGDSARVTVLAVIGAIVLAAATVTQGIPCPERQNAEIHENPLAKSQASKDMLPVYWAIGVVAFSSWPIFLGYAKEVMWPSVDLGLLGALQIGSALMAAGLWRVTEHDVLPRARLASLVLFSVVLIFLAVRPPVDTPWEVAITVFAVAAASVARTTILLSLLEMAHRTVTESTSVRDFTILDVVASSLLQIGLFLGGLLIAFSVDRTNWWIEPYRLYLLAGAIGIVVAVSRLNEPKPA